MRYAVTYPFTLLIDAPDETEAHILAERQLERLAGAPTWLDHLALDPDIMLAEDLDAPHILPEDFAV